MSLASLTAKSEKVTVGADSFTVHPLTVDNLATLISSHKESLNALFSGEMEVPAMVVEAPSFVAAIIAVSTHEEGDLEVLTENARALPLSAQVIALDKIWGLTVYDPKEFMAVVKNLLSLTGVELPPEVNLPPLKSPL